MKKQREKIGLFSTSHCWRATFSHFPGIGLQHPEWLLQKTNIVNKNIPLPPPFLSFNICANVICNEISLGSVWISCPGCVFSQSRAQPQPTDGAGKNAGETVLTLCQHCPAATRAPLCYQHLSSCQWKAQHCEGC